MLTKRIIPCLDIEDGKVVKGKQFKRLRDAGDPVELARRYNNEGADEIVFLDIAATYKSRKTVLEIVEKVSDVLFIPLTVGGGIRNIADMRSALNAGADKVAVCSAAIDKPELLQEAADIFGSQCIVVSIDAKRNNDRWYAYRNGGRENTGVDALDWSVSAAALGAGEILLNSIDMDGTKSGYDLELTLKVSRSVRIPVIASGGAGCMEHILEAFETGEADAALVASLLHFKKFTIKEIKDFLKMKGVNVR